MILYKVDLLKLYEGRDSKTFFVKLFSFVILFLVSQCYWNVVLLISISDSHLHYFYTERNFLNKIRKITFYSFWCIYTFDEAFCQKSVPFFQISSVFSVERFDRSRQYFMKSTAWAIKSTKRLVRWNMRFTSEAFCLRESHQMLLPRCRFGISYLDLGMKRLYPYKGLSY